MSQTIIEIGESILKRSPAVEMLLYERERDLGCIRATEREIVELQKKASKIYLEIEELRRHIEQMQKAAESYLTAANKLKDSGL